MEFDVAVTVADTSEAGGGLLFRCGLNPWLIYARPDDELCRHIFFGGGRLHRRQARKGGCGLGPDAARFQLREEFGRSRLTFHLFKASVPRPSSHLHQDLLRLP